MRVPWVRLSCVACHVGGRVGRLFHRAHGLSASADKLRIIALGYQLQLGNWTSSTRPGAPGTGWLGYNVTTGFPEYWNGSAWTSLGGGGSGSGTVTNLSGVNTNGFSWSIANPTTTPAITLLSHAYGRPEGHRHRAGVCHTRHGLLTPTGNGSGLTGMLWSQIGSTPTTLAGYGITNGITTALANGNIFQGNSSNLATPVTLTAAMDVAFGSTQGSVLYRSSSGWTPLAPGLPAFSCKRRGHRPTRHGQRPAAGPGAIPVASPGTC